MTPTDSTLAALDRVQEGLAATVAALSPAQLGGPSYCQEWSVAQVLSHLGSGSEVFTAMVTAALAAEPLPGPESFPPIWDRWNAKEPADQAADGLAASRAFNQLLAGLDAEQLALPLDLFGMALTLADVAAMRLSELTLHAWDIQVSVDPATRLPAEAVDVLIDKMGRLAGWTGQSSDAPRTYRLTTTDPARSLDLALGEAVVLTAAGSEEVPEGAVEATVPAEALIRLIAGRLDADHTPGPVGLSAGDLDDLRVTFPGP